MAHARVGQDETLVVLEIDGRAVTIPPSAARTIARALLEKASMAEEHARANEIILYSAILLRAGVPIGLSSNPKIQAEARKEAVWNRDLRRYMRGGGIASGEQFGAPTITQHPPARRNA